MIIMIVCVSVSAHGATEINHGDESEIDESNLIIY